MAKCYFPGANSGEGFYSRFSGIVPPCEKAHYTYVLKGGPGVGKNTLMKKVASVAREGGYTVEEFRCASDPTSLDAVRVVEKGIVVLDGTAPHSIDPVLPGICDEVIDLGYFKNQSEFAMMRQNVEELFLQNKGYYRAAYSMLGAANKLKKEVLFALSQTIDKEKVGKFLSELFANVQSGEKRELFARSATPEGVIDYAETFLPIGTVAFSGIWGEAIMFFAKEMLFGKRCEVFYDFLVPDCPRTIAFDGGAIAVADGGDSAEKFFGNVAEHVPFLLEESEKLVAAACGELSKALEAHDEIEKIYREYVDYTRVNEKASRLLEQVM